MAAGIINLLCICQYLQDLDDDEVAEVTTKKKKKQGDCQVNMLGARVSPPVHVSVDAPFTRHVSVFHEAGLES